MPSTTPRSHSPRGIPKNTSCTARITAGAATAASDSDRVIRRSVRCIVAALQPAFGVTRILQWSSGLPSAVNAPARPSRLDLAGDHRGDVDFALGDRPKCASELDQVVPEHELQVELFRDRPQRRDRVVLHADADDHDPSTRRRVAEDLIDHAGYSDGLEHDRRIGAFGLDPVLERRVRPRIEHDVGAHRRRQRTAGWRDSRRR